MGPCGGAGRPQLRAASALDLGGGGVAAATGVAAADDDPTAAALASPPFACAVPAALSSAYLGAAGVFGAQCGGRAAASIARRDAARSGRAELDPQRPPCG